MSHGLDKETTVCGWQWCLTSLAEHWDKDPLTVEAPPSEVPNIIHSIRCAFCMHAVLC